MFVGNMNYDEFISDDKTTSAVIRKLEIIGEASENINYKPSAVFSDKIIVKIYTHIQWVTYS